MPISRIPFCALLALLSSAGASARAAEPAGWTVQVTPYVWAQGLDGRVRPGAGLPTVDVGASFGELLEDVDVAAFGFVSARRGEALLVADGSWANASRSGTVPPGLPASAGLRQGSLTLLGGRTVLGDEHGSLALLAGLRGWSIRARASVPLAGLRASPSLDFADPLVGARAEWRLGERWSALVHADVGGFGVGSESTWQFAAIANHALGERTQVSLGYRHLYVDYERRGVLARVALSGPVLGFGYRF